MTTKMRDIMSAAPVGLPGTATVAVAARAMAERGIGAVLVSTDGHLTGLVTDRDIAVRVLAEDLDPKSTSIADICPAGLFVLGPDDDLAQAARLIRDRAVRRIPIVEDGVPLGIVSVGDLALEQDEPAPSRAS